MSILLGVGDAPSYHYNHVGECQALNTESTGLQQWTCLQL